MNQQSNVVDVTIIGGGPVGLFTAFYGGMRQMSVKIIESLPQLGGQLSALYPEKYIYDVAGFPKVRAQELVNNLKEQMKAFKQEVCLEQAVETIEKQEDGIFKLTTNKEVHFSRTIIITAGNGAFQPRKLKISTEEKFEGKNLHYFVDNLNSFTEKDVVVFGGGDSAVDWALMLEPIANNVTIAHRREKFRAHEHSVENLTNSTVNVMTPYVPVELRGSEEIEYVVLENVNNGQESIQKVDAVVVNYGFISSLVLDKRLGA